MLALSTLHVLLSQVLAPPTLHTVALITNAGALVSYATVPSNSKDHVKIIVGLSTEVWQETHNKQYGMVDSELGRVLVLPVYDSPSEPGASTAKRVLMLVCLNSTEVVSWEELRSKGEEIIAHLSEPLSKFKSILALPKPSPAKPSIPVR